MGSNRQPPTKFNRLCRFLLNVDMKTWSRIVLGMGVALVGTVVGMVVWLIINF